MADPGVDISLVHKSACGSSNYGLGSCVDIINTKNQIMSAMYKKYQLLQMNDKLLQYGDSYLQKRQLVCK